MAKCNMDETRLRGDWGELRFFVELADTEERRAKGLMFRKSMPQTDGMLFACGPYLEPKVVHSWYIVRCDVQCTLSFVQC